MSRKRRTQKMHADRSVTPTTMRLQWASLGWPLRIALVSMALVIIGGSVIFADWWSCLPETAEASYVGSGSCIDCHRDYYDQWKGSHHDLAMDRATPETVLGDFNDVTFEHHGIQSRMFRRDGKFMINTEGPDGEMTDFEVKYVFGLTPLQQYMVEFDRPADLPENEIARLQVLRITWDTPRKRWFYLPPPDVDEKLPPDDDLHWTGIAQRWNNMCADCHSTNLQKNYNDETGIYHTTFSEIDVSCEACHGPASLHVELANERSLFWDRKRGYGLADLKSDAQTQIDTCAPCHSRRRVVHPGFKPGDDYYDFYANELMEQATYFADGQILDEDYVYGSFIQSKMYHKGIRCSDCHDPHSVRTKHQGNEVCTSCHQHSAGKYDTPAHHFHKPGSTGALCVECHMPETTYMEVDPRRDHSIRIPRPDLSVKLGLPNACTRCHLDKEEAGLSERDDLTQYLDWMLAAREGDESVKKALARVDVEMDEACRQWYGRRREGPRAKSHFSETLIQAREGDPDTEEDLIDAATDVRLPGVIRATAMLELARYGTRNSLDASLRGLKDTDPQVRATAIGNLQGNLRPERLESVLTPSLSDPVRLVRTEAARVLATTSNGSLPTRTEEQMLQALEEFESGLMVANDRAASHMTWGIIQESLGLDQRAVQAYRTAIQTEPRFAGPRTNLAALYDRMADESEQLMRRAISARRRDAAERLASEVAEHRREAMKLRSEELACLERDAKLVPNNAAIQYRLGMLLYLHRRMDEAEESLVRAHELEPNNPQFLLGIVLFYKELRQFENALPLAQKLVQLRPEEQVYRQVLNEISRGE